MAHIVQNQSSRIKRSDSPGESFPPQREFLDEPTESEVERLWLQEAERRLQEFREGRVQGIPAEKVFNRAIADIL
ncbi:MAG: hypothetical protein EHM72_03795 [Calditrichaeota bacterium]|nr:MAG: hypothetical protein EHM72_03795 [Calditrichota bacterium]